MQPEQNNKKGILIFGGIVIIFLIICLFGYMISGDKGIEERFSNAVGLPNESVSDENGIFGFTIEGNKLSYGIIIALILTGTVLIYLKYRI